VFDDLHFVDLMVVVFSFVLDYVYLLFTVSHGFDFDHFSTSQEIGCEERFQYDLFVSTVEWFAKPYLNQSTWKEPSCLCFQPVEYHPHFGWYLFPVPCR